MTTTTRRVVNSATVEGLLADVLTLALDGWAVSEDEPGEALPFGSGYMVTMERTDASVAAFKARADAIQAAPKLTPQERMAKARAARGKGKLDMNAIVQD